MLARSVRPVLRLALPVAVLASCHAHRSAPPPQAEATAAATPAAAATPPAVPVDVTATSPAPDIAVDAGPVEPWYRQNAGRIVMQPAAAAADLTFAVNLIDWVVKGDEAIWARMAERVERAASDPAARIPLALLPASAEEARAYHEAAAPLSARPQAERDPAAEDRLYRKALLLNPTDPDLYNHLSIAASLQKDYRTGERWAKLAIAIDPGFLSAYQELAYALKNLERYRDAIAVAERGLRIDGDLHVKALLLARQGQSHWMLSEEEAAITAFRGAQKLGGPAWVNSYLEGKQELGKPFKE